MIVAGIDYDTTKVYLAIMGNRELVEHGVHQISLTPREMTWNMDQLRQVEGMFAWCKIRHIETVYIEEPLYVQNGYTTVKLASVFTVLNIKAVEAGLKVVPVNNRTWKRIVIGKGNASKAESLDWVRSQGILPGVKDHNVADSICIAQYGIEHLIAQAK